jgi:hypothetical protein
MGSNNDDAVYLKAERGLYANFPQLRSVLVGDGENLVSLLVKRRGDADYLVVLKRESPKVGMVVAFGSGFDVVGALLGLEGTLAAGRWKADTPWKGGK